MNDEKYIVNCNDRCTADRILHEVWNIVKGELEIEECCIYRNNRTIRYKNITILLAVDDKDYKGRHDWKELGEEQLYEVINSWNEEKHIENHEEYAVYALQFAVMRKQIDMLSKAMLDIGQHIKDKVRKSLEVDWGISNKLSDRLFTETIVELQIIEQMINDALDRKGE